MYATSVHLASANLAVRWYKPPLQPIETTPEDYEEVIHILLGDEENENLES